MPFALRFPVGGIVGRPVGGAVPFPGRHVVVHDGNDQQGNNRHEEPEDCPLDRVASLALGNVPGQQGQAHVNGCLLARGQPTYLPSGLCGARGLPGTEGQAPSPSTSTAASRETSRPRRAARAMPARAPGLAPVLGYEAGIQDQQCPPGGHGQAREGEGPREPARMGVHRPAAATLEGGEVDALQQPRHQLHQMGEVDCLRFAAGHQYEYIAQPSHGKLLLLACVAASTIAGPVQFPLAAGMPSPIYLPVMPMASPSPKRARKIGSKLSEP